MTIAICKRCNREMLIAGKGLCHSCTTTIRWMSDPAYKERQRKYKAKYRKEHREEYNKYFRDYHKKVVEAKKNQEDKNGSNL